MRGGSKVAVVRDLPLSHPREPEDRTDEALPWRPHMVIELRNYLPISLLAQSAVKAKSQQLRLKSRTLRFVMEIGDEVKVTLDYLLQKIFSGELVMTL
jgi:hypothetical protein